MIRWRADGRVLFRRQLMARFIMLATFTEKGIAKVQDTIKRTENVKVMAKRAGVTLVETYWTLGAVDVVAVLEAPDDETITAFSLSVAKLGNVRTQTLRAFTAAEMPKVLKKMV